MKNYNFLSSRNIIKGLFLIIFTAFQIFNLVNCESVCDHELLIMELKQDLEDNGILDCLR